MTSKFAWGGDKMKVKAVADDGYYPTSLSVGDQIVATNDDAEQTELEGEIDVPNIWPKIEVLPQENIEVIPEFGKKITPIYGVEGGIYDTSKLKRIDAAVDFPLPNPYFSGIDSSSSPFDNIYPWSEMNVEEHECGSVVCIPKFYYNLENIDNNGIKIQITQNERDGFRVSPAHMDRNDGHGERNKIYVGRYHCSSDYTSKKGEKPIASIKRSVSRENIHKLGSNIWQFDWATLFTIWLLYIVEFADFNSQNTIGYGCSVAEALYNTGGTDDMPYHTGTKGASRELFNQSIQYRNIEGLWSSVYDWVDGCYVSNEGFNVILNPNSFDDKKNGVLSHGLCGTSMYPYPSSLKVVDKGFLSFYPDSSYGNEKIGTCDKWVVDTASNNVVCFGGSYNLRDSSCGLFYIRTETETTTRAYTGCRLIELPNN